MTTRIPDEVAQTAEYGSEPLARQLRWIIGIRLVIVTSVLLPYFLLQLTAPDQELGLDFLYGLAGLTYAASLLYIGLLRLLRGRWALQAFIQFFGDLLLITGLVFYFGGIASPFSILYFIVIIVASALFRRRTGYAVAALAGLLYSVTILGFHFGWLPQPAEMFHTATEIAVAVKPPTAGQAATQPVVVPGWRLIYNLFTHIFGFFMVAYLTTRLAQNIFRAEQELQERQDDLADLQIVHRDVIQSIPSGLITCDLESVVTSANLAAQEILQERPGAGRLARDPSGTLLRRALEGIERQCRRLSQSPTRGDLPPRRDHPPHRILGDSADQRGGSADRLHPDLPGSVGMAKAAG